MTYKEFMELVKARRTCRKFIEKPVEEDKVRQVMESGLWAAQGRGRQAAKVIRVKDAELQKRIREENAAIMGAPQPGRGPDPFYGAPEILLVVAEKAADTHVYDGSLVLDHMMLAAHTLGLGSCWIHRARQELENMNGAAAEIMKRAGLDIADYEGIGHLALGYAEALTPAAPRKEGRILEV